MISEDLEAGVHNLLVNCADVRSGETLLWTSLVGEL